MLAVFVVAMSMVMLFGLELFSDGDMAQLCLQLCWLYAIQYVIIMLSWAIILYIHIHVHIHT